MYSLLENISWWQDWMLGGLVVFAVAFYWLTDRWGSRKDRPIAADWAIAAETLGGTFRDRYQGFSDMRISGTTAAGVGFEVTRVMTDRYGGVATRYKVQFVDPALPEFHIVGKGEVTAKARLPRLTIGDDRFDEPLRIRSRDERTQVYLTPALLEASLGLVQHHTEVRITNSQIVVQTKGLERDPSVVLRTVATLMDVARLVSPQLAMAPRG